MNFKEEKIMKHLFYDGSCWAVIARSYAVEKSNDLAVDRDILWIDNLIYHYVRLSV